MDFDWQTAIVAGLGIVSVWYLIRKFWGSAKGGTCSCSSDCPGKKTCPPKKGNVK